MLWQLMENSLEELKLLQTVLVLLTTNTVVHDEALSKVRICYWQLEYLYPRGKKQGEILHMKLLKIIEEEGDILILFYLLALCLDSETEFLLAFFLVCFLLPHNNKFLT